MSERVSLQPVDAANVTILVDNSIDLLLSSSEVAQRPRVAYDMWEREREQLIAEHGLSLLLTIEREGHSASLIYDAGLGRKTALHNMDILQVRLPDLRTIVMSHGHSDHHGGLEGMIRRVGARGMPLVIHPEAWRDRKIVFPTGAELHLPPPSPQDLEREGVAITEERQPSLLIDGTVLVTGQVERVTDFEKGFPLNYARLDGSWEPDPWIWDDQAVVVNLKGKGLVVLSGCSHAGAINVLHQAQRLTGEDRVHAFVGGMHLTGGIFEPLMPRTLDELARISPRWLVPGHCTGWKATHEISRRFPEAYVQSSVGTQLQFA
ncbi:MAG: MBL fold metallo-hydrolase [Actinobacteria bacterium]|nr:MBL fold metallo-hydrolase [Actinomycetota bacterium]MCA1740808.1 MBL fold metallo-hydrolase [Actinomycetota bacterium]